MTTKGRRNWLKVALSPRHIAFWALLSSVATVVAFVVTLLSSGFSQSPNPNNSDVSPKSSAVREGYSVITNPNADVLAAVGPSGVLGYAMPFGQVTSDRTPSSNLFLDCYRWAHANGGEDFGVTVFQFTIAAQTVQVVADSVELEILEKRPVRAAKVIACGGGDRISGRFLRIDLDRGTATFTYDSSDNPSSGPFGLLIRPNDAEQIQVIATTSAVEPDVGAIVWRLKLNLIVDGVPTSRIVDNSGSPFVTVSRTGVAVVQ